MQVLQTDGSSATFYRSYLVRLWQSNEQGLWRASAQCVQTGNTIFFGDMAQLITFLDVELGSRTSRDDGTQESVPIDSD